jgi:hypothetical protein
VSVEIISLGLNHSKAKRRAKLVLLGIANHQGDQGAWPSIATLARYTNESERSVKRDIQELIELGELQVIVNGAPGENQYKPNLYWVTIDPSGVTNSGVTESAGVTKNAVRGDKNGTSGVTPSGTQTINKPYRNLFNESWQPNEADREKLVELYPSADLDSEVQAMIDYLVAAGKQKDVKDMSARFRTWMRNADKFAKGGLSKKPVRDEWYVAPENRSEFLPKVEEI